MLYEVITISASSAMTIPNDSGQATTNKAAQVRLAQLYHVNGDSNRALALIDAVTELDPEYPVAWETRARIAIEHKDWPAAEAAVAKLRPLEGQATTADYLHGQVLASTGKMEEAVKVFTAVIDADPSSPVITSYSIHYTKLYDASRKRKDSTL